MATIVGISGSLRRKSYNAALLRAAARYVPKTSTFRIESISAFPLYNFDLEESAFPQPVARLKDAIAESDGLLLVTPEFNNSIPGVFKNAIDWLSRPADDADRVFRGLNVALMGASPGRWGTGNAQAAWLPIMRTLEMRPWFEDRLQIAGAGSIFDDDGNITNPAILSLVSDFVEQFVAFVERHPRER